MRCTVLKALPVAAEFPSKGFVHGFRKFAKLAKAAVLLLVLKGVADGLVSGPCTLLASSNATPLPSSDGTHRRATAACLGRRPVLLYHGRAPSTLLCPAGEALRGRIIWPGNLGR